MTLVSARIVECGYRGGFALRDVYFDLQEGDFLLITGRSGSGKTTLIRAITGTLEAVEGYLKGEVYLCGHVVLGSRPEEIYSCMVYIPQEPWYAIIGHTVYAEICHSLALEGRVCNMSDFSTTGLTRLFNRLTHTLSAGETQRVLWAELALRGARVLVLDEPLVYLDEISRSHVRDIVERALGEGVSTILVDHNPFFWEKLEPRLIVLENGRVAYSGKWSRELLEKHTGKFTVTKSTNRASRGVYAELRNVWYRYPGGDYVLVDVNMTIQRGVITAITGPNGSGKTTLLKIASGVLKPSRGSIVRRGASIYIPENPLLYFTMPTPREELLLAARGEEYRVLDIAEYFNIKHTLDQPIVRLSSGERRRVALASAYLYEFSGYFIDEPTGGLDYDSARLVLDLLEDIAEDGKAVVIATHDERAIKRADLHAEIKK